MSNHIQAEYTPGTGVFVHKSQLPRLTFTHALLQLPNASTLNTDELLGLYSKTMVQNLVVLSWIHIKYLVGCGRLCWSHGPLEIVVRAVC